MTDENELLEKFKSFVDDPDKNDLGQEEYLQICEALDTAPSPDRQEKALQAAHNLSGMAANLWRSQNLEYKELLAHLKDVDFQVETIKAALTAPEPADKWLPIDSAPRDGTPYLSCVAGEPEPVVTWWAEVTTCVGDKKMGYKTLNGYYANFGACVYPTHWMPLPSPPSATDTNVATITADKWYVWKPSIKTKYIVKSESVKKNFPMGSLKMAEDLVEILNQKPAVDLEGLREVVVDLKESIIRIYDTDFTKAKSGSYYEFMVKPQVKLLEQALAKLQAIIDQNGGE